MLRGTLIVKLFFASEQDKPVLSDNLYLYFVMAVTTTYGDSVNVFLTDCSQTSSDEVTTLTDVLFMFLLLLSSRKDNIFFLPYLTVIHDREILQKTVSDLDDILSKKFGTNKNAKGNFF